MSTRPADYRVIRSASAGSVSISRKTLHRIGRPPVLSNRVHSLVPHLPFGVSSSGLLAAPFGAAVLPGFRPSSRHHRWRPRARAFPGSRQRRRPQAFSASRRITPPPALRACCIPQPRPGLSPFRGFSLRTAVLARRQSVPPCRCRPSAHRQAGCHPRTPRLRGLAPCGGAFLRVGV